jgi:hypothetical protein
MTTADDWWENTTNGMIFEFKEMEQAKAFAAAVKSLFDLDGRVFDNVEDAYRAHVNPFVQHPPVAHIDRPFWKIGACKKAWKIERKVEKLALKYGGELIGT